MPRYIDADLIEPGEIIIPCGDGIYEYAEVVYMDDIREIPTADVVERKAGKWIWEDSEDRWGWACSNCGYGIRGDRSKTNYCPNCGAEMKGEDE